MSKTNYTFLKTITLGMMLIVGANQLSAQSVNNGIFFQAVARDNFSNPAKERKIYVQSSVIQTSTNGPSLLVEQFQVNTDGNGMFSISIGNGTRVGGTASGLNAIDWSQGPFFLNLKIAITPAAGNVGWDYTKEWVNIGTTSFGAVPYALYSANAGGVNQKLSITDTTKMLAVYAKSQAVQALSTTVETKLSAKDTLTMLAPYARAAYVLDSAYIKSELKSKITIADSATSYVTPSSLSTAINTTVNASTLTGTTLKSTVTSSSLTSVGTLENLTVTNPIVGSITGNAATATNATNAGTASTATKLATTRNINGVAFDGSGDITLTANAGTLTGTTLASNVVNSSLTSVGTLTSGTISLTTNITTSGALKTGTVTYPNTHGTSGQVLSTTGSGTLSWTTVSGGVPYTGATGAVNLGAYDLTVNGIKVGKGGGNKDYNTAIGIDALLINTTGNYNTANGAFALSSNTIGESNTAVGISALEYNTTGFFNTAIGNGAGVASGSGTISNTTAIGNGARVSASNTIQLGNTSVTNVKTSGTITANAITYPNTAGTNGQVLTSNGSGTASWQSKSAVSHSKLADATTASEITVGNLKFRFNTSTGSVEVLTLSGYKNMLVFATKKTYTVSISGGGGTSVSYYNIEGFDSGLWKPIINLYNFTAPASYRDLITIDYYQTIEFHMHNQGGDLNPIMPNESYKVFVTKDGYGLILLRVDFTN
jgi:hypothetical protein